MPDATAGRPSPAPPPADARRVVIGDLHGDHRGLQKLLREIGVIDWNGKRQPGYYVRQLGDLVHCGPGTVGADIIRTGDPWSRGSGDDGAGRPPMSDEKKISTWVKVNGVYPSGLMVEGARSRDRLVLHIPKTQGTRDEVIPEHSVSIEMKPVLWAFRKFLDASDRGWVPEDMNERCGAELLKEGRLIATCQMEKGHPHDHTEFGSTVAIDNWPPRARIEWSADIGEFLSYNPEDAPEWWWEDDDDDEGLPPSFEWGYTGRTGSGLERMRATHSGKGIRWRLRLPAWEMFQSHRRGEDSLTRWLFWVARELGGIPEGDRLDPMRVFLCEQDHGHLLRLERFWAERLTGETSDSWLQAFQLAPAIIGYRGRIPKWARPGWAYVVADAFRPSDSGPEPSR